MLIVFFILSMFLAFANVHLVKALDFCMDYTGILDFIRLNRFRRHDPEYIDKAISHCNGASIEEKVNTLNAAYHDILFRTNSKSLKSIMCMGCMTIRFNLYIQILLSVAFAILGVNLLMIPFVLILSVGINYFFYEL